jgi:hypothetical protein
MGTLLLLLPFSAWNARNTSNYIILLERARWWPVPTVGRLTSCTNPVMRIGIKNVVIVIIMVKSLKSDHGYTSAMKTSIRSVLLVLGVIAAFGIVAATVAPSIIIPQQAFADNPWPGNSFGHCAQKGPGHSDDACKH